MADNIDNISESDVLDIPGIPGVLDTCTRFINSELGGGGSGLELGGLGGLEGLGEGGDVWDLFECFNKKPIKSDSNRDKDFAKHCTKDYIKKCTSECSKDCNKDCGRYSKDCKDKDLICESCNGTQIILDDGNYVCECGTMVSRYIDMNAEWRFYGNEDSKFVDPTRCGMATCELLPNSSLGSTIGYLKHETHDIYIMRKYHMWNSMTYKERSLYNIFDTLTINAINNGISKNIIEEAKALYKQLSDKKISRGDNRNGLIASSIYVSCKNNKVPRSAKEIAKIFNLTIPTMTRGCKKFQEIMKINMASTNAEDFVFRFCSKLNLDKNKGELCKLIVLLIEKYEILSDSTPPSMAAGSIYMCNHYYDWGITKKNLSLICDISQVTISKCFKKLSSHVVLLFESNKK